MATPTSSSSQRPSDRVENFRTQIFRIRLILGSYWWILILTLALSYGYQFYSFKTERPVYTSSASLIVSGRFSIQEGTVYSEERANFYGTQIALIESNTVRQGATSRLAALDPDLEPVEVSIDAGQRRDTSMFIVTAKGTEPKYTQAYLDACLQEYRSLRRSMRSETSEETLMAITNELQRLENEIKLARNNLLEFQKENNLVFIREQGNSSGSYLAQLKTQRANLQTQLKMLSTLSIDRHLEKLSSLDPTESNLEKTYSVEDASESEEVTNYSFLTYKMLNTSIDYGLALKNLRQLKTQRSDYLIFLKEKHPKILRLDQEAERAEQLVNIYRKKGLEDLMGLRNRLESEIQSLDSVIADWEETALGLSQRLAEYDQLRSGIERPRKLYDSLLTAIQSIDLNMSVDQERVSVHERASIATPFLPSIPKRVAYGGFFGLGLGAAILFLIGSLQNGILSADDLSERFAKPVLAVIPAHEKRKKDPLMFQPGRNGTANSLFTEACRNIRSYLMFTERAGTSPRTILVTSSLPKEGKSTLAANIASTLASAGLKTLLVDADLRRGDLHTLLGLRKALGLSEIISKNIELQDALQSTETANLHFISCGENTKRPGELLLSERMNQLFQESRERFEYVIFDSAPVLAIDDTTSFAARADAILFTVRSADISPLQIKGALDRLNERGGQVYGFILNFVSIRNPMLYYYGKYSEYYKESELASSQ